MRCSGMSARSNCETIVGKRYIAARNGRVIRQEWLRRRVRLYYWKQWKQARTRRRNLIKLGADPAEVKLASRSRKGYWRMSSNRILQQALTNHWLEEHGAPNIVTRRDNRGESGEFYFEIITGNLERGPVGM